MRGMRKRSTCPISHTLDLLGDQWSLLVVRDLMFKGKRRYRELLTSDEGIATNILADRLRTLVAQGFVNKTRNETDRKSYVYRLTQKGRDLAPILLEMILWSGRHDPGTVVSAAYMDMARRRRAEIISEMQHAALD